MSWKIFGIIVVISIIIFITKKWGENIKKIFKTSRPTKISAQTSNSTPNAGNTNPPPAGHANSSSDKSKTNWFSKIFWTMATIVLTVAVLVFLAWALPFIKKTAIEFLEPSPQYKMVLVYNRTVSVNLDSDWSDANTVYLEKGEKCTFKDATVSFCVHNLTGQMVCGDAYTDPDLPPGSGNEKMWFKSKDGPHGTIEVVIFRREKQLIK